MSSVHKHLLPRFCTPHSPLGESRCTATRYKREITIVEQTAHVLVEDLGTSRCDHKVKQVRFTSTSDIHNLNIVLRSALPGLYN